MLSIDVKRIPEEGTHIKEELAVDVLMQANREETLFTPQGTGTADLSIQAIDDSVRINGSIDAEYSATCVNCLEKFSIALHLPVELFLTPHDEELEVADDLMLDEETSGIDHYEADHPIELEQLVAQVINVALPMHPRCAEDCKGLCPQCGANLNHEACSCEAPTDPRWDALKQITIQK